MRLPDRVYDVLKWIALCAIPAIATFYCTLAPVWGWPLADQVSKTANAVCTLIGALIAISTAEFRKGNHEL